MVTTFTSVVGDDWRQEAEALRLQEMDDPKRVLQRRNVSQIRPDTAKASNCRSTGRFLGVAVVGLLVALGRERKTLSGSYGPLKHIRSLLGGFISSVGSKESSNQDWKKQKPSVMAAEAAEARHGGKKKKNKKKKKRSH